MIANCIPEFAELNGDIDMRKSLMLTIILALALGACRNSSPAPSSTPTLAAVRANPTATATLTATHAPPSETPAATETPTATPIPQDYGPDNFPENVDPLIGSPVENPTLLDRHPVMVKIQTFPRGQRPPWGVSLADIVYDYYQNNGITRLAAIFYSQDAEEIGPIRSARLLDRSLVSMYKSVFAFGGADRRILRQLYNSDFADQLVVEGNDNCPPMCRVDPNGYNFLTTNSQELTAYATEQGVPKERQDLDGMTFQHQPPQSGETGQQVYVRYSISAYTRWDYDPETSQYMRFQDTQEDTGQGEAYSPFTDRLSGEQVKASNVVVLYVTHEYTYKSGNSEIIDILLSGSGKGVAFRDGQAYQVNWNRPTADSVLFLTYPDGTAYPFKPGATWFQVVGQSSSLEKGDGGVWRFVHNFP
jgi:hypothetical protein